MSLSSVHRHLAAGTLALLLGCTLIGCALFDHIERQRQLGIITYISAETPRVSAPDSADHGVPFNVSIGTYGFCGGSEGDTQTSVSGLFAEVRPYDMMVTHMPGGMVCNTILYGWEHTATITFASPGIAQVRFVGRAHDSGAEIVVNRSVVVR